MTTVEVPDSLTPPRWLNRRAVFTVVAAAVAALASGLALRYFTVEPRIHNYCGGAWASEVKTLEAGGYTEYEISYRKNQRFAIAVCVGAAGDDDSPTILNIYWPDRGGPIAAFVGTERRSNAEHTGATTVFKPFRPLDDGYLGAPSIYLWFEMPSCNGGGTGTGFSSVLVDYRWRGRERTMRLDLNYTVTQRHDIGCAVGEREADHDFERHFYERYEQHQDHPWHPPPTIDVEGFNYDAYGPDRNSSAYGLAHNLCRYLWGIEPMSGTTASRLNNIEPLEQRAVFRMTDVNHARAIVEAAIDAVCPEFESRRSELLGLLES